MQIEEKIEDLEDQLAQAMQNSNIAALETLLHCELRFVNHLGQMMGKDDDLRAHKAGLFKIHEIQLKQRNILVKESFVIVNASVEIDGSVNGIRAKNDFVFTRIWCKTTADWQVIAAHSSLVDAG